MLWLCAIWSKCCYSYDPKFAAYHDVVMCYMWYVRSHFGSQAMVVFDGYSSGSSVKDHEHLQSVLHLCRLMRQGTSCSSQQLFLANCSNKSQFIALLGRRLSEDVHTVYYSLTMLASITMNWYIF